MTPPRTCCVPSRCVRPGLERGVRTSPQGPLRADGPPTSTAGPGGVALHSLRCGQHLGGLRLPQWVPAEHAGAWGARAGPAATRLRGWRRLQVRPDQGQVRARGLPYWLWPQGVWAWGVHSSGGGAWTPSTRLVRRGACAPWGLQLPRDPLLPQTMSIVSYNHLGNNDGQNLSAPPQFRSKEVSKSSVVDDLVQGNPVLYAPGEEPDHCVRGPGAAAGRGGGAGGGGRGPRDLVPPPRWSSSTCRTWGTASGRWTSTRRS